MKRPQAPAAIADINVTPMVDVMLVLLIIFMVITPMLNKGAAVDMVKAKNRDQDAVSRRQGRCRHRRHYPQR